LLCFLFLLSGWVGSLGGVVCDWLGVGGGPLWGVGGRFFFGGFWGYGCVVVFGFLFFFGGGPRGWRYVGWGCVVGGLGGV